MKKTLLILLMGLLTAVLLPPFLSGCATETPVAEETAEPKAVDLYVFLYDRCGGCGVDNPGCGNCEDIVRYHGIIKGQLGDRLYDDGVTYRMKNCRMEAHYDEYEELYESYGGRAELRGHLPTFFIGSNGSGIYMVGEEALEYIGEMFEAYVSGTDPAELQAIIDERYEKTQQEKAQK